MTKTTEGTESSSASKPPFTIAPRLPALPTDPVEFMKMCVHDLPECFVATKDAVANSLNDLAQSGAVLEYVDLSDKLGEQGGALQLDSPDGSASARELRSLRLPQLTWRGFLTIGAIEYAVALPASGPFGPPIKAIPGDRGHMLIAPSLWRFWLSIIGLKTLKSQTRFRFRSFVGLNFPIFPEVASQDRSSCQHDFFHRDLGAWQWRLVWECRICGLICHCECFRGAIARSPVGEYVRDRYAAEFPIALDRLPFQKGTCEVCRGVPSTHEYCHEMYARSLFYQRYGAYIMKRIVETGAGDGGLLVSREVGVQAENALRKEMGFRAVGERFVTETEMFRMVERLFPGELVVHHFRAPWLQGLELDVYLPSRKLGIEYHGEQHFEPVEAWGGSAGLRKTQQRDAKKIRLCQEQGVTLVAFTCEDEITEPLVRQRILTSLAK